MHSIPTARSVAVTSNKGGRPIALAASTTEGRAFNIGVTLTAPIMSCSSVEVINLAPNSSATSEAVAIGVTAAKSRSQLISKVWDVSVESLEALFRKYVVEVSVGNAGDNIGGASLGAAVQECAMHAFGEHAWRNDPEAATTERPSFTPHCVMGECRLTGNVAKVSAEAMPLKLEAAYHLKEAAPVVLYPSCQGVLPSSPSGLSLVPFTKVSHAVIDLLVGKTEEEKLALRAADLTSRLVSVSTLMAGRLVDMEVAMVPGVGRRTFTGNLSRETTAALNSMVTTYMDKAAPVFMNVEPDCGFYVVDGVPCEDKAGSKPFDIHADLGPTSIKKDAPPAMLGLAWGLTRIQLRLGEDPSQLEVLSGVVDHEGMLAECLLFGDGDLGRPRVAARSYLDILPSRPDKRKMVYVFSPETKQRLSSMRDKPRRIEIQAARSILELPELLRGVKVDTTAGAGSDAQDFSYIGMGIGCWGDLGTCLPRPCLDPTMLTKARERCRDILRASQEPGEEGPVNSQPRLEAFDDTDNKKYVVRFRNENLLETPEESLAFYRHLCVNRIKTTAKLGHLGNTSPTHLSPPAPPELVGLSTQVKGQLVQACQGPMAGPLEAAKEYSYSLVYQPESGIDSDSTISSHVDPPDNSLITSLTLKGKSALRMSLGNKTVAVQEIREESAYALYGAGASHYQHALDKPSSDGGRWVSVTRYISLSRLQELVDEWKRLEASGQLDEQEDNGHLLLTGRRSKKPRRLGEWEERRE